MSETRIFFSDDANDIYPSYEFDTTQYAAIEAVLEDIKSEQPANPISVKKSVIPRKF